MSINDEIRTFWNRTDDPKVRELAHWRGALPDRVWRAIGEKNLRMYYQMVHLAGQRQAADWKGRVLEWGVGGGSNLWAFAPMAAEYWAVDISSETLDRCLRDFRAEFPLVPLRLHPRVVDAVKLGTPEECSRTLGIPAGTLDLFLCTAVLQHVVNTAYAERLVFVARHLLRPDGVALVQTRYMRDHSPEEAAPAYADGVCNWTLFGIEEFQVWCEFLGFEVLAIKLEPASRSAYYYLAKKGSAT